MLSGMSSADCRADIGVVGALLSSDGSSAAWPLKGKSNWEMDGYSVRNCPAAVITPAITIKHATLNVGFFIIFILLVVNWHIDPVHRSIAEPMECADATQACPNEELTFRLMLDTACM